jgi:hypothetical protein
LHTNYKARLDLLSKARAVHVSGGWLGRAGGLSELAPFIEEALRMVGGPARVLTIPTPRDPGKNPADEINLFQAAFSGRPGIQFPQGQSFGHWPSYDSVAKALTDATFVTIQGGNFPDFLELAGDPEDTRSIAHLLVEKYLSGEAVFLTSSAGTVCWGDEIPTADRPAIHGGGVNPRYRNVAGWKIIPAALCAHYNERNAETGDFRGATFQQSMNGRPPGQVGIGLDTQTALVFHGDGTASALSRDPYAHIQFLYATELVNPIRGDHIVTRALRPESGPVPLSRLFGLAA